MLIKHVRWAVLNVKDLVSAALPWAEPALTSPAHRVRCILKVEGGLWTLTLTIQLPFTENAPPFCAIKNIIFLPANFLC